MLYNDHTFKTRLKEFMPFLERKALRKGEKYQIGDEVEAIERRPVWYPGVIKRAGENGTYDVLYDDGELVETILPVKIRFRATYKLSMLVRLILFELLFISVFSPLTVADLYTQPRSTPLNPIPPSYYDAVMTPFMTYIVLTTIAIFCSCVEFFFKTAQAGISTHLKIFFYLMLPYIFAILFVYIVNHKMKMKLLDEDTDIMWYHAW